MSRVILVEPQLCHTLGTVLLKVLAESQPYMRYGPLVKFVGVLLYQDAMGDSVLS